MGLLFETAACHLTIALRPLTATFGGFILVGALITGAVGVGAGEGAGVGAGAVGTSKVTVAGALSPYLLSAHTRSV